MSSPAVQQEQLLELLLQLKKTTPEQARTILNSQPQIAYALLTVMVNINAISVDVVQKTLSEALPTSGASMSVPPVPPATLAPAPIASSVPTPIPQYGQVNPQPQMPPANAQQPNIQPPSAIPPHLSGQPSRGSTPPYGYGGASPYPRSGTPTYGRGISGQVPQPPMNSAQATSYPYQGPPPQMQSQLSYGAPGQIPPPSFGAPLPQPPQLPPSLQDTLVAIPEDQKALIMRVLSMTPEEIQRLPPQERSNITQLRQTLGLPA